jgi:hypothetical protein
LVIFLSLAAMIYNLFKWLTGSFLLPTNSTILAGFLPPRPVQRRKYAPLSWHG